MTRILKNASLIVFCLIAISALAANAAPAGQADRQRVKCYTSSASYLYGYALEGIIDWNGDEGAGNFVLLRQNFPYDDGSSYRRLASLQDEMVYDDNGIDQVIRTKNTSGGDEIFITWRSDLPHDVPAVHYAKINGRKYTFSHCRSEVSKSGHGGQQ